MIAKESEMVSKCCDKCSRCQSLPVYEKTLFGKTLSCKCKHSVIHAKTIQECITQWNIKQRK